jgi:hypothetical protein
MVYKALLVALVEAVAEAEAEALLFKVGFLLLAL